MRIRVTGRAAVSSGADDPPDRFFSATQRQRGWVAAHRRCYAHICSPGDTSMNSWFSPKTEKRASPIQGRGLFARDAITAGEIVAVKGGTIMDSASFALVRDEV